MIAYIKGQITQVGLKAVIIIVNGLGYEVFLTPKNLAGIKAGEAVEFFIYSNIKEDAFDLYGFKNNAELDFFKKVISVSGIGPKSALNILGLADVNDLKRAISQGDAAFLQQVSGIGKKTAERLVVELKEKFIDDLFGQATVVSGDRQVIEALMSLGYKEREAQEAIKNLSPGDGDLASRIKNALKSVSK